MFIPQIRAESIPTIPKPGVSQNTFLGLVWTAAALSLLSVLFRLYSRIRGPGRLFLDDFCIIFGEALVLITAGLWQWGAKFMYYVLEVDTGIIKVPSLPRVYSDLHHWLQVQLIAEIFFYTTLILVKLSFLFFFKRLGENVRGQKQLWWPVLAFALIVYFVSIGNMQYKCYTGSLEVELVYCTSAEANDFTMTTMKANMALDVFSDFLIMLLPITLLWNVRLPLRKKLAFMGLFSLTVITMVVAIVRAVNVNSSRQGQGQDDATFLWLWTAIQASLAVMISCLSAFPQLFSSSSSKKKPVWTPTDTYYQRLRSRVTGSKTKKGTLYDLSLVSVPGQNDEMQHHNPATTNQAYGNQYSIAHRDKDSSFDSLEQEVVLVPQNVVHKPTAMCYGGSVGHNQDRPQADQITRKLEYRVTEEHMPQPQRPCSQCGHSRGQDNGVHRG